MNDLYETLGVAPDASPDEIKKAYRDRALATHPDHGGSEDEFKLVSLAGSVLTDPDKRQRYDETGSAGPDAPLNPVESIVAELVSQSMLQKDMPNEPIRWMQEQIDCVRINLRSMIAEHEHKLRQFNTRLTMFTKNNEQSKNKQAVTLISNMLRTAIKDEEKAIATCKANLQFNEDAMVFLNDLKYPKTVRDSEWPSARGFGGANWQVTRNSWGGW